jgi:predicted membrane-bound spermidine synthase
MATSPADFASLMRLVRSYFVREVVELRSTPIHPRLEVVALNGRLVLNGLSVNYSFGSLHRVFDEAFQRLKLADERIESALLLGMGAGSVIELLCAMPRPPRTITAVEIDPVVVDIAKRHFHVDRHPGLAIVTADAAEYVRTAAETFDLCVIDLFIDARIPDEFQTSEFLRAVRHRVRPGGWIVYNCMVHDAEARDRSAEFERRFAKTLGGAMSLAIHDNLVLAHRAAERSDAKL